MSCCGYVLTDERVGDLICENCGKLTKDLKEDKWDRTKIQHDFIETICSNNNIVKVIEEEAIFLFYKRNEKRDNNAFAAYCIYSACKIHHAARSLIEIAKMCFINVADIAHYNVDEIEILPSDLVERALDKLEITSFRQKIKIKQFSDIIFNELLRCSPPQSALAVAIFTLNKDRHISQNLIAKVCDTSLSCVRRLCRIYKNDICKLQLLIEERSTDKGLFYKELSKKI